MTITNEELPGGGFVVVSEQQILPMDAPPDTAAYGAQLATLAPGQSIVAHVHAGIQITLSETTRAPAEVWMGGELQTDGVMHETTLTGTNPA